MEKREFVKVCWNVDSRVFDAALALLKKEYPRRKMEAGSLHPDENGRRRYYIKANLTPTEREIFRNILFKKCCSRPH